jgi:hypothetical protein
MQSPSYFNNIQRRASERWDQLENDPELAGPWHQLFRQVQSPRHVVSELLQNADDAGAKSASVRIEEDTFIFEHDGDDFDHEQFASLFRDGVSDTQDARTVRVVSDTWSRPRRNTTSRTRGNTSRNTSASVIIIVKAIAPLANGLDQARTG